MPELPLSAVMRSATARLTPLYGEGEARAMMRLVFENLKGWSPVDLAIRASEPVSEFIQERVEEVLTRLLAHEPIQYIFGNAHFYGLRLKVTPSTLIPRPETAELVDIILRENSAKDLRVLDLCTGSGCIALALARNLPFAAVTAVDLSRDALAVARENGTTLRCAVDWREADVLSHSSLALLPQPWDIIVSNPPYIAQSESAAMEPNVLCHEPHMALFVPDADPLRFYRAIAEYAAEALTVQGTLYFEINPLFANEMRELCLSLNFREVELLRDTFGKLRFLTAKK